MKTDGGPNLRALETRMVTRVMKVIDILNHGWEKGGPKWGRLYDACVHLQLARLELARRRRSK